MKEIRTTKMVEQTEVKFVADDGREFSTEKECKDYERKCNIDNVIKAFERLDVKKIDIPVIEYWYGDDARLWKVTLYNHADYVAFQDYLDEVVKVWDSDMGIAEPKEYPYTTLVGAGCEWAYEYGSIESMKAKLQTMIEDLEK